MKNCTIKRVIVTPAVYPRLIQSGILNASKVVHTSMIAQNDRNKILSNFYFIHFFPGCLQKLNNGTIKIVIVNPAVYKYVIQN